MGGRGASSGAGSGGGGGGNKPAYLGETEKAVRLRINVEDHTLDRTLTREVWVPKSQLSDDGRPGEWITDQKAQEFYNSHRSKSEYSATWKDANGKEFSAGKTAREKVAAANRKAAFDSGKASYNELISYAKKNGVKGVRSGMKRSTIERKIAEAGIKR